jgi:RNA polymerase sigma-70 factor (ECF subfamily)
MPQTDSLRLAKENPNTVEEEDHLVLDAQRDPKAFGKLYLHYIQPVYRYLYSRTDHVQEAEDLTAQTFLAAFEAFGRYRHEGHFRAWLFKIARLKTMDYFRRNRPLISIEQAEQVSAPDDPLLEVIQTERAAALAKLIRSLPEDEREILRLRYVAELSFGEIGSLLNRNEEAVKKTIYRLLARLKNQLEVHHD